MTDIVLTSVHTKTLIAPDTGSEDKVYGQDYVASDSHSVASSMATGKLAGRSTAGTGAVEEISVGSGLTLSGGTLSASGNIVFAAAPNSNFDLTNGGAGGAVTILSKSVTGIAAGDQIEFDIWYTILNNSGAGRSYTANITFGGVSLNVGGTGFTGAASATNRQGHRLTGSFAVSASNLTFLQGLGFGPTNAAAAAGTFTAFNVNAGSSPWVWNSTTNDLTGTQTVTFTMTSGAVNTTQTLTLHRYVIRKISTV